MLSHALIKAAVAKGEPAGETWYNATLSPDPGSVDLNHIACNSDGSVFLAIVTHNSDGIQYFYRSFDGRSFTLLGSVSALVGRAGNPTGLVHTGTRWIIGYSSLSPISYRSTNNGSSWTSLNLPLPSGYRCQRVAGEGSYVAVTNADDGRTYFSVNGGTSFPYDYLTYGFVIHIGGANWSMEQDISNQRGYIHVSQNGGASFYARILASGVQSSANGAVIGSSGDIYAYGLYSPVSGQPFKGAIWRINPSTNAISLIFVGNDGAPVRSAINLEDDYTLWQNSNTSTVDQDGWDAGGIDSDITRSNSGTNRFELRSNFVYILGDGFRYTTHH